MHELLAGTVPSEVGFGYLIIIKLNNTTLYVFSKNTQYKHCLTLNHRLQATNFFFLNGPTSGQKLESLGILLKPHPLLPHIPVSSRKPQLGRPSGHQYLRPLCVGLSIPCIDYCPLGPLCEFQRKRFKMFHVPCSSSG